MNRDKKRSNRQYEGGPGGQDHMGPGGYDETTPPSLSRLNMDPHGQGAAAGDSWV